MKKLSRLCLSLAALTSFAVAGAQALPSAAQERERAMLWAGLSTEFLVLPGVHVGLSVPLGQAGAVGVGVRGTLDTVGLPGADGFLPVVGADLLLSRRVGRVTVYGGPGVATVLGTAWGVGGTVGLRDRFGEGRAGWFTEARARYILGGGGSSPADGITVSPGLRAGLTYLF